MSDTKLLPCPFDGGEAAMCVGENNFNDACVRCQGCMTTGPNFDEHEGELDSVARLLNIEAAVAAWNTRALTPKHEAAQDMREALESMTDFLRHAEWDSHSTEAHVGNLLEAARAALAKAGRP